MSLESDQSRIQYPGNNSATNPYPVPFLFFDNEDLRVVVTTAVGADIPLTLGTDFTATGAGDSNGGNVVTAIAWNNTFKITIYREVTATQETVYEENADFPAKSHERALDKLTMLCQQIFRNIGQSLRFRESDGTLGPIPAVPDSLIGLDALKVPRAMTAAEVAVWLNLTQELFGQGSLTFLNQADRDVTTPQFLGQIGIQLDTLAIYAAHSITAGDWGAPDVGIGTGSITTALLADGVLTADTAGRLKMADAFITLAKIGAGIFTADATGRGKFAAGFVDPNLTQAGLWNAIAPSGAVVQTVFAETRAIINLTTGTTFSAGDLIPQYNQGVQFLSLAITPRFANSKLLVRYIAQLGSSDGQQVKVGLWRDASATNHDAIQTAADYTSGGGLATHVSGEVLVDAGAAETVFTLRGASAWTNAVSTGSAIFGGTRSCSISIMEIKQ